MSGASDVRFHWTGDNYWSSWFDSYCCPRGTPRWKTTPLSEDGMTECPTTSGEMLNGMMVTVTPTEDGARTMWTIEHLTPQDHPWAWTDAPAWPSFNIAPRTLAAQQRLDAARRWVRYRLHRIADAWLVLVGRKHVADDYDW